MKKTPRLYIIGVLVLLLVLLMGYVYTQKEPIANLSKELIDEWMFDYYKKSTHTDKPRIITRKERGADESLTYDMTFTGESFVISKKPNRLQQRYNEHIRRLPAQTTYREDGHKLIRPIEYVSTIKSITIHHTADLGKTTDKENLDHILYLHSTKRGRGDIGYHFIIGLDGDIYEGRKGGEKAIGAHVKYNNPHNIGISMIGDYDKKEVSPKQQQALEKLIKYLVNKHRIDMSDLQPFLKKCTEKYCASVLRTVYKSPIMTHGEIGGPTQCPGKNLFHEVQKIKKIIQKEQTK